MYCPECRYEYREGTTVCPDCGVPLMAGPPPEASPEVPTDPKDWVPLAVLTSPQYVEMLVETFRSHNIPVVSKSSAGYFGQTGQMGATSFQPAGKGYVLYVAKASVADANREGEAILGEDWIKARLYDLSEDE